MSDFKASKCIKFDFRWGSAADPAGRAYSARRSTDPLAVFTGLNKESEGMEKRGGEER